MTEFSVPPNWLAYVENLRHLVRQEGNSKPVSKTDAAVGMQSSLSPVLLFSPHPDDESITGLLPLRLLREEGRPVIDIAVTLGSNEKRREQRANELEAACRVLGFAVEHLTGTQKTSERLRDFMEGKGTGDEALVEEVAAVLDRHRPALVLYPHARDRHPTHVAVARLLEQALTRYSVKASPVLAAETECWQPMPDSNLAVEGDPRQVAMLCEAIAQHAGEVARNPFHLRQPVRLMENFFRAGELIRGFGGDCGRISFAELYTLFCYRNGIKMRRLQPLFLASDEVAGTLLAEE